MLNLDEKKLRDIKQKCWCTYGHDNDETGWDVRMEQVIAQTTLKYEYDLQTGEVPCDSLK